MRLEIVSSSTDRPVEGTTLPRPISAPSKSRVVLQSWKSIAAQLDRGVRTVQRWEQLLGLPVHRLGRGPRAPVFAYADELLHWLSTQAEPLADRATTSPGADFRFPDVVAPRLSGTSHSEMQEEGEPSSPPEVPDPAANTKALQAISAFLTQNQSDSKQQSCSRCAGPMQFVAGYVWLYGAETSWQISLPFCPDCKSAD